MLIVIVSILLYVVFGLLSNSQTRVDVTAISYVQRYIASILVILSIYQGVLARAKTGGFNELGEMIRNTLGVSCVITLMTPYLSNHYSDQVLIVAGRFSGIFENPNEAGMIAGYLLIFAFWFPTRRATFQTLLILLSATTVSLTFSKAAMLCWIIIALIFIFVPAPGSLKGRARTYQRYTLFALLVGLGTVLIYQSIIIGITTPEQYERISELKDLLILEINEDTTTNRSVLLSIGLEKLKLYFPFGAGFGTFHSLEGGLMGRQGWLGVHNTFVMVIGESGLFPGMLLVLAFLVSLTKTFTHPHFTHLFPILVLLVGDFMTTHNGLEMRYTNFFLGFYFAVLALRTWRKEDEIGPNSKGKKCEYS